jgi:tagatose-6-phosphate ketose/aldose isomerase
MTHSSDSKNTDSDSNETADFHTHHEINWQPKLWLDVYRTIASQREELNNFLLPLISNKQLKIILTGAGSSAFIGKTIQHAFYQNFGIDTSAISTTSLVTHFENSVSADRPLLLISFARSGNSPESNAVIDIAEQICNEVHHIAITCNPRGSLAKQVNGLDNGLTLILPPEAEDKALAMTGSFTGMLLAAALTAKMDSFEGLENDVKKISVTGQSVLDDHQSDFEELAEHDFNRIVFLGSGPLLGIARESHLKVQELTNGEVIGKHDSFLGFRHGPKVVVNRKTIVVYLFSADEHVFRYEKDLADEIMSDASHLYTIGIFPNKEFYSQVDCDLKIDLNITDNRDADLSLLPYVIPAQLIGLYKSIELALNPDTPSDDGAISRVVKGVHIYPKN